MSICGVEISVPTKMTNLVKLIMKYIMSIFSLYFVNLKVFLAITYLFIVFDVEFYISYHETFPLHPGYDKRLDIYNLYPLLVHVNLFGGSYKSAVAAILKAFR